MDDARNNPEAEAQQKANTRRHRRFAVDVLDIRGNAVFAHAVSIQDISVTGVSLGTDQKLEVGRQYALRIIDDHRDLSFTGTVIWTEEAPSRKQKPGDTFRYTAGLQFTGISQENEVRLIEFIGSHLADRYTRVKAHEMSGYRFNVRYQVDQDEAALLSMAENYRVLKLSLGGILIESEHSFEPGTRLSMEMTLPDAHVLAFIGRVASSAPSPVQAGRFHVGIAFTEMADSDRGRLKLLIRQLYLEDAGFAIAGGTSEAVPPPET